MATLRSRPTHRRPRAQSRRKKAATARAGWPLLIGVIVATIALWTWLTYLPWTFVNSPAARLPLTADEARASNVTVPIVHDALLPAKRFVFRGSATERRQAIDCLATAALYEAGRDAQSQKAVVQVILNRVRLSGYPKTICGVVYQGARRATGCQFSFTCDGSVLRRRERNGWAQARGIARRALNGYVYRPVGRASHYHTDWMVPYWRGSLDKVAQIDTHIFYRRR